MYNKLLKAIKQHDKILFLGEAGTGKSHILRLLLPDITLRERVIIEKRGDIEFIKRNLWIDPNIRFESFEDVFDIPEKMVTLTTKTIPFLTVVDVPSIQSSKNGVSLFDIFKEYLSRKGEYRRKHQVNQLIEENIDLVVAFSRKQEVLMYRFGNTPDLLYEIGRLDISNSKSTTND